MDISRKQFLQVAAGAAAAAAVGSSGARAASTGRPKRGVSIYSYAGELNVTMTLEDCMADMYGMDAEGIEILANGHIEGYPNPSEEMRVLNAQQIQHPIESLESIVKVQDLLKAIAQIREVYVSPAVQRYIIDLVGRTRQSGDVYLGASPRGSLALFRTGQARAALLGRDHVLPDDIKALAVAVLGHRIIVSPAARLRELSADRIVQEIVYATPVPGGDYQAAI